MRMPVAATMLLCLAMPVFAQTHEGHQMPADATDPHAGHTMPIEPADPHAGHTIPSETADPHAGHTIPSETADPHAGHTMPSKTADPHAGHSMHAPTAAEPPPAAPTDHAADAIFGASVMAVARKALLAETSNYTGGALLIDLAEYQAREGSDGFRWEGEGWYGGDFNRLVVKFEGEGEWGGAVEEAEVQALYSRAIAPYFNLQAGVRYDIKPDPSRGYLALGVEGLAPYWFDVSTTGFVSDKGDAFARLEVSYDQRITQKLILQPRAEFNLAAQDVAETGVGAGLSDVEIGVRLRYEIRSEFAPYIGVEWSRQVGNTADFARARGEDPDVINVVFGIRAWF